MAQRLAAAVREAVELYAQLSAFDEGADPTHAVKHALFAPLQSMPKRIAAAVNEAPGRPLPASLVTKLAAMVKEAGRRETNSMQADFLATVIALLLIPESNLLPDETRTAQFTAVPGFVESLAAAIVTRAALSDNAAPQFIVVAAAVSDIGRPCTRELLKIAATLINAPGDLISAISSALTTASSSTSGLEDEIRSAALRLLCSFLSHDAGAAARCVADSGLVDQALAHAHHDVPTFRHVAINLLAALADTDRPDVGGRLLASPQAEAAVTAALSCLRRPFRPNSEHSHAEGMSITYGAIVLGAAFRNPMTAPAAMRAAAQGAAALVAAQQLKDPATDWAAWFAAEALGYAAACDAAWAVPLPTEAKVWWARHLEAAAGTNDDDPYFLSGNSLNATRAAATLARRGGAAARTAWEAVEQRPAVLDTLRMQLAEYPPRLGRPSNEEDTGAQLHLLTARVGELLGLLASQATPGQRRVMIRRRHFLPGLAKTIFTSAQVIAGGAAGLVAANAVLKPLRTMARLHEEGKAAADAATAAVGLQHNQDCLVPGPGWLPAGGSAMADALTSNLRDAARALEVLTGADGADGEAACDALLAACPKETEALRVFMAGAGGGEGHPLLQVSQRLQARKAVPREGGFVPACGCCGATTAALLRCSRCLRVGYCSRECQAKAWKEHKPICHQSSASGGGSSSSSSSSGVASGPVPTACTGALEVSGVMRALDGMVMAPAQPRPQQAAQPRQAQQQQEQQEQQRQQQQEQQQEQQQQEQQQEAAVPREPGAEDGAVAACATCGKTEAEAGVTLKRCKGCRAPSPKYCSAACYEAGWPAHKAACKAARAAQEQQQEANAQTG